MNQTVRVASGSDGVVSEMRQMVQVGQPAPVVDDPEQLERTVSAKVATFLMVMLVAIIFATSAVPDVGPSLAKVIQAHICGRAPPVFRYRHLGKLATVGRTAAVVDFSSQPAAR